MRFLWALLAVGLCGVVNPQKVDPYCQAANCPLETTCRVVKTCANPQSCRLDAQCLPNPPQFSHTSVCITGDPILVLTNGALADLTCGPGLPCPANAYCNTDLLDTYSTCCLSDPGNPIKAGECPANNFPNDDFCLDTCNNDGDCRRNDKCCVNGCNRECIPPQPVDPCKKKVCSNGYFCQRPDAPPSCSQPGKCWAVGDCVPCPPVCYMFCENGNVKDPNGCPICQCLPPSPPPPTIKPQLPPTRPQRPPLFPWTFGIRPQQRQPQQQQQNWWSNSMPSWLWALLFMS